MSLDIGRAMIAAVLVGLAVDDSVHLLTRYQAGRREGMTPAAAMSAAVLRVGRPVATTSLALAIGLLTFLASPWQTVSSFGFYMSVGILGALAADLLVLPALVVTFARAKSNVATEAGEPSDPLNRIRGTTLTLILVAPIATCLLVAAGAELRRDDARDLPCWILPNGRVAPLSAPGDSCPLRPHDQVHAARAPGSPVTPLGNLDDLLTVFAGNPTRVDFEITRDGEREWHEIRLRERSGRAGLVRIAAAALAAGFLLCIPLLLVWRSSSPAVVPFSLFYSGISTVLVAAMAGHSSVWLARIATMIVVFLPATLIHLAFTFPRQRAVFREAPALATTPYLLSLFLVPPAWIALERDALLWPSVIYLLLALTAGAWLILLVSCGYAMRESTSALERARARVLCYGALLLPIPPVLLLVREADGVEGAVLVYLGAAALTMPLPIGLAISRYNLFNLEVDARTWIARLIYAAVAASVVGAMFTVAAKWLEPLSSPALVFAVAFAGVVAIEPIRRRLVGIVDAVLSPDAERLRNLRKGFARLVCELRDPEEIARLLQETLQVGLSSRGGCVFLRATDGWRPASAFGEPAPTSPQLAEAAVVLLRNERLMDLGLREASGSASERLLRHSRIQLIGLLEHREERSGLVLLTDSEIPLPYNRLELDFVSAAIEQATIALYNARLAEDLIAAERQVTTGRIALALAHDVGKELDWLHRLVQRLPERLGDPGRASRDLRTIGRLTEDLVGTIRGFVRDAREPVDAPSDAVQLDHVIERAVRSIDRLHRARTVTRCVEPAVRELLIDPAFERDPE
jgi:hypothetical protein